MITPSAFFLPLIFSSYLRFFSLILKNSFKSCHNRKTIPQPLVPFKLQPIFSFSFEKLPKGVVNTQCLYGLSSQSVLHPSVAGWVGPTRIQNSLLSMTPSPWILTVFPIYFPLHKPPATCCLSENFSHFCPGSPSSALSVLLSPCSKLSSFRSHFSAISGHPQRLAHPLNLNLLYSCYSAAIL